MRHLSIPKDDRCEFLDLEILNPLIAKCKIKVCYVGNEPNRNRTLISKAVAKQMANSLPGCPIVGFFDEITNDFLGHERALEIKDDGISLKDITRPYGFVDLHANVWFQTFIEEGQEREYLMTEGYIWNKIYKEAQVIIDEGRGQSMEIFQDEDEENSKLNMQGYWANLINGEQEFFIINEALISKLCILGESAEPCFEGASITSFSCSFEEEVKNMIECVEFALKEKGE